ncbi:MAG: sulfotransferase, partial [Schleiferiaceae bacterium]|nr:sulfotransferase [Schleiferiaceae bacterium]
MMKSKANLFLIGAAKSGTTALASSLGQHPAIASLPIKEPGHFSTDLRIPVFSSRYNRLLQWDEAAYFKKARLEERHIGFVESESNYQKLVDQAITTNPNANYVLDASTAYLYSANAPAQLRHYAPDAKIVLILRNPVERAYSHYTMALKYGMEQEEPLQAFQREAEFNPAHWGQDECYLELGQYAKQLERWLECFPLDQLHIIWYDDFTADPQKAMNALMKYLDLPTFVLQQSDQLNAGAVPKYATLNKWA